MHYRRGTRADLPAITDLYMEVMKDDSYYRHLKPRMADYPEWARYCFFNRNLERMVLFPRCVVYICVADEEDGDDAGTVIGYASFRELKEPEAQHVAFWDNSSWTNWLDKKLRAWQDWYISALKLDPLSWETVRRPQGPPRDYYAQVMEKYSNRIHLNDLAVSDRYRRRRIATKLLEFGIKQADLEGTPLTLISSIMGEKFYETLDFVQIGVATNGPLQHKVMVRHPKTEAKMAGEGIGWE